MRCKNCKKKEVSPQEWKKGRNRQTDVLRKGKCLPTLKGRRRNGEREREWLLTKWVIYFGFIGDVSVSEVRVRERARGVLLLSGR